MRLGTNDQKTSQMRALYVRYCAKKNLGTHIVPNLNHPNKMFMIGHVGVGQDTAAADKEYTADIRRYVYNMYFLLYYNI